MKHAEGRVLIKADLQSKNSYRFENGTELILDRNVENLNHRETMPVQAVVVSGEGMRPGSQVLIHHNSLHRTNEVNDVLDKSSDDKYFSIPYLECYLQRVGEGLEWKPLKGFATALRMYYPYTGTMAGVKPELVKDVLWITSGEFKNKACMVLKASDYEIIYQGDDGREHRKIRVRHFEDEENEREEIIAINQDLTNKVKKSLILIGLNPKDAKTIKEYAGK